MDTLQAKALVRETFTHAFDKAAYQRFVRELLNRYEPKSDQQSGQCIAAAFRPYVSLLERFGTYTAPGREKLDLLIVHLTRHTQLHYARTALRNVVAHHLKKRDGKDAALVAFVSPSEHTWRFSFVKMEYAAGRDEQGKVVVSEALTPARRYSYLVGEGESCHTAQSRFLGLLQNTTNDPPLEQIADAFSVETVTKEFFNQYHKLFGDINTALMGLVERDDKLRSEFERKAVAPVDFAKKLLGQIVFLYFIQKKGWLGVEEGKEWGYGPRDFLRRLVDRKYCPYTNFFNDVLEPLFYDTLATDRARDAWCALFKCRIPFLNGGLFEPLGDYDWEKTDIVLPNELFTNGEHTKDGDVGTGVLDVFDRYNFTVNEAEPLEQEVAIDPEMLGKVFENLIEENRRKGLGAFYTPREIVHYMCQESLVEYLYTALNPEEERQIVRPAAIQEGLFSGTKPTQAVLTVPTIRETISRDDLEALIQTGEEAADYEAAFKSGTTSYDTKARPRLPKSIETHATEIDDALQDITVCDPAIGSGAFPVGMMMEIVRARLALNPYFDTAAQQERTAYHFKRHAIQRCVYGVDIDHGAVEIAKLRLWLSLVVDEKDPREIRPLPNLDFKIVSGNSLLGFRFQSHGLAAIEELKEEYFGEPDHSRKAKMKKEIDRRIESCFDQSEKSLGYRVDFDYHLFFSEVFRNKGGFDVVIANPPYIGESGHKDLFRLTKSGPLGEFYLGKMDYFYFFFHLALQIARPRGEIAFITTNYYPTASGARKLRAHFKNYTLVRRLVDFNELRIFESAQGQHNMITLLRKGSGHDSTVTCVTARKGQATSDILTRILRWDDPESRYFEVCPNDLYDGSENYIRLSRAHASKSGHQTTINSVLDKMAAQGELLGTIANVNQGVVSGCDYVSSRNEERLPKSTDAVQGDGIFVFDLDNPRDKRVVNGFSVSERRLLKAFYKNSDIGRYSCSTRTSKRLLYIGRDIDSLKDCPNVLEHLKKFKAILSERREVENGTIKFFQLQWPRREDIFAGEKIVVPYRSQENAFAYNSVEWFCRSDCYVITQKYPTYPLGYLLALLNSRLYFQWLFHRGKRKGKMLEMFQIPLSEIPVKRISHAEQRQFVELTSLIMQTKRTDNSRDTRDLESEVDRLVYALYDLADIEVDLVRVTQQTAASA